jgi:hypothetical protein
MALKAQEEEGGDNGLGGGNGLHGVAVMGGAVAILAIATALLAFITMQRRRGGGRTPDVATAMAIIPFRPSSGTEGAQPDGFVLEGERMATIVTL